MTVLPYKQGGNSNESIILLVTAGLFSITQNTASSTPHAGDVEFLDPTNQTVSPIPDSSDLDTANSSMSADPFSFFALQWNTQSVELLGSDT